MRRFLMIAALIPAPLLAQEADSVPRPSAVAGPLRRGLTFAVTGFTGGQWQPSGVEAGMVRAVGSGSTSWVGASVRLGSFVQDQAVYIGRTTGFFVAALVSARTSLATLAVVGTERNPSFVRLIGMVEGGVSLNINSPLPQGGSHLETAALFGLSFGGGRGRVEDSFALLVGPAGFFGKQADSHLLVALRYQTALRR